VPGGLVLLNPKPSLIQLIVYPNKPGIPFYGHTIHREERDSDRFNLVMSISEEKSRGQSSYTCVS